MASLFPNSQFPPTFAAMHPKDLSIHDFTYELPDEKIALFPAHPRDSSRLLIYHKGNISEDTYRNIVRFELTVLHQKMLYPTN